MAAEYSEPTGVHLAWGILGPSFRLIFHALSLAIILGKENVPLQRGVHSNYVEDNGKTHQ